jgi:hypothetical protein
LKKLLVVVSSLDLTAPLSSTPSWWQLLKALAERGIDLLVTPYQGPAIESPWWAAAPNPCQREGDLVTLAKRVTAPRTAAHAQATETASDRLTRVLVERWTKPRWRQHLLNLLGTQRDVDAVLFLTVPPNHFGGIPRLIAQRFGVPTYFYDGDVPASLPRFAGFRTGFRIYQGADLSEYAAVLSSSVGGVPDLEQLGARAVHVLHYAADPSLFTRPQVEEEDIDVFFYGHGAEYRAPWIEAMLVQPAQRMPEARFAVRATRLGNLGRITTLPYASFSKLKEYCCRSRINVLITRQAHATVYATSTARPFELAALGCAMVSNPYLGVEAWFEPGTEILLTDSAEHAVETYRWLLGDPAERRELGRRARQRLINEHTYAHRAQQLSEILGSAARPPSPSGTRCG